MKYGFIGTRPCTKGIEYYGWAWVLRLPGKGAYLRDVFLEFRKVGSDKVQFRSFIEESVYGVMSGSYTDGTYKYNQITDYQFTYKNPKVHDTITKKAIEIEKESILSILKG